MLKGKAVRRIHRAFGDDVLQRFGELLRAQVRPTDIVTRVGGDEFAAVMPHTALPSAFVERSVRCISTRSRARYGQPERC